MKNLRYIRVFTCLLGAGLLAACTSRPHPVSPANGIVFVFEQLPDTASRLRFPGGGYAVSPGPYIVLRGSDLREELPSIDSLVSDTIVIPTHSDRILASIRYNFQSHADVLLHNGDTLLFGMTADSLPRMRLKNRTVPAADLDYDALYARRFGRMYGFTTPDHYRRHGQEYFLLNSKKVWSKDSYRAALLTVRQRYEREIGEETSWLDSLRRAGALSDEAYDYFHARNVHRKQMFRWVPNIPAPKADAAENPDPSQRELLATYDDSLYRNDFYGFYHQFYKALGNTVFTSKKIISQPNSRFPDSRESFDRVAAESLPLGLLREELLADFFRWIDTDFSIDDAKRYYDRLDTLLTDSVLRQKIAERYGDELGHPLMQTDDIVLLSIGGDTTTLNRVLEENRGKVVYADFYASWCHPCMEGMPASEKLRKEYARRDVVFVYMALNDKPAAWRNAVERARLQGVEHNYLVLDPRLSTTLRKLRVNSIPRLLLFGRDGTLAHKNAPRPESPQIRSILDAQLAE